MQKPDKDDYEPPACWREPLGESPAVLAKRDFVRPSPWCPKTNLEFDPWCDPDNPKTVTYKDILNATSVVNEYIPPSPLKRSKCCVQFEMELNYKFEIFHNTGSFKDRGALYALSTLNKEQRQNGVLTASTGNWALALAFRGQQLGIPVTVVLPVNTMHSVIQRCQHYEATVILFGGDLSESTRKAFLMIYEGSTFTFINGYDHPHIIAANGSIGLEILNQLPQTDVIIVPIGGGGLIAGIAAAIKKIKPKVLIYGVEANKCCCFFKAMENERPYKTAVTESLAASLAVPTAGCNSFHTSKSLIDKMVLVDEDWIARAILHMVEEEKIALEGAGVISLAALFAVPNVLTELRGKTVVCIISGATIDSFALPRCFERAKAIEGRLIKLTLSKVLSIVSNVGCNVLQAYKDKSWLEENDFYTIRFTIICETLGLGHACTLKRVMEKLFPNICNFLEEPFSPIPICACYPRRLP
ncbi:hypothetical protein K1T71_010726 [Dendrolimus kikuchii]|uniref:Uncharacterized protein n=1 Tax=Dendrolimus kikuchii TaxID=765133 RepID=A0ACC1CQS9_9NEOP|nr:hypothetical protein K1T71_010726 [Dendrolimus kikuchii]